MSACPSGGSLSMAIFMSLSACPKGGHSMAKIVTLFAFELAHVASKPFILA